MSIADYTFMTFTTGTMGYIVHVTTDNRLTSRQ